MPKSKIYPIAIHLPQFHPIPENDKWWGKGFTEWTNVTKAKPLFNDHYQPHLPSDLGFYDLRLKDARLAQIDLAKKYGIYGFCYYHYWFNGKRILNIPIEKMLENKEEDFPFMLCWANENWTRRWDGKDQEILLQQNYDAADDRAHIQYLLENVFNDYRYIKIDGKPFFAIYKPNNFPDIKKTIEVWREEASKKGLELFLAYFQSTSNYFPPEEFGFDSGIEFPPFGKYENLGIKSKRSFFSKVLNKFGMPRYDTTNTIYDYGDLVKAAINNMENNFEHVFRSITPMWDNSSRRKSKAIIFRNSSPELYGEWLQSIVDWHNKRPKNERKFIFINAWNEWAEGNHLEPCQKWGLKYLEKTKIVLNSFAS